MNGYVAKSFSPIAGRENQDLAYNVGANYQDGTFDINATYTDIQENFTNEMGFVPRTGIRKFWGFAAYSWRPVSLRKWIRSLRPHAPLTYIVDPEGKIETREVGYHFAVDFQNGSMIEMGANPTLENIVQPFIISNADNIQVLPGNYRFTEYFIRGSSDESRRFSGSGRFDVGEFYNGYKHSYTMGAKYRIHYRLNASFDYTHNNISLPQPGGHFKTNLFLARINYSFSTTMFLKALVQYNSDLRRWSSNIRFNFIHRPLSDFYLVYNEQRDEQSGKLLDRAVIAKFTYMFAQ
jgi:predicted porin